MVERTGDGFLHEVAKLQGQIKAIKYVINEMETVLKEGK